MDLADVAGGADQGASELDTAAEILAPIPRLPIMPASDVTFVLKDTLTECHQSVSVVQTPPLPIFRVMFVSP